MMKHIKNIKYKVKFNRINNLELPKCLLIKIRCLIVYK